MPTPPAARAAVTDHPGSTADEIDREPNWGGRHQHRIGYVNRSGRVAGLTHDGDHAEEGADDSAFVAQAESKYRELETRRDRGGLINFNDVLNAQTVSASKDIRSAPVLDSPCNASAAY